MNIRRFAAAFLPLAVIVGLTACKAFEKSDGKSDGIRDIPSTELIKEIKTGWNLGNTFDAPNETAWGNPKTTPELMKFLKESGFDAVRVPVTWDKHMDDGYAIDGEWLDRVEEVVGYVTGSGMYCILNSHHEEWLFPDEAHEKRNSERLAALWKQLSERFADYDEKLIFEGMNEPRLRGTKYEWSGGTDESREVVNRLNAVFVKTVRESGGNNKLRHLMISPYAASGDAEVFSKLEIPENDDKIIVSIHAYIPYSFALNAKGSKKWSANTEGLTAPIDELFGNIKETFTDKGVAVIIGETGALSKDNDEYRTEWAKYYFGKAREYGVPCFWWDNGLFVGSGETFGLVNRREVSFRFPEVANAVLNRKNY